MRFPPVLVVAALISMGAIQVEAHDLKAGDKIAIVGGQSFEIWGWSSSGYARLLVDELAKAGMKGDNTLILVDRPKIAELAEHLDSDVIPQKPAYVLIIPGTVDYNPWAEKTVPDSFKTGLAAMIDKLQSANIKSILVTSYASNSELAFPPNRNVAEHNDAIRALAAEKKVPLIDFVKVVDESPKLVPLDGSPAAKSLINQMLAGEILRSVGYSDQKVAACRSAWLDNPAAVQFLPVVSVATYDKLQQAAKASGQDVDIYMNQILHEAVK